MRIIESKATGALIAGQINSEGNFTGRVFENPRAHRMVEVGQVVVITKDRLAKAYQEVEEEKENGCPQCGSHEGDATECPECGHGQ